MVNNNGSRRVRTSALTRGEIAEAALRMFAEDGLAGLSMRRLGSELGVHYSTLYWHISDKRELLRLVLDAVLADVPAPNPDTPVAASLAELFSDLRAALRRHPGAAVLVLELGLPGPHATAFARCARELLVSVGLDERRAEWAYRALMQYTAASVQEQAASPRSDVDRLADIDGHEAGHPGGPVHGLNRGASGDPDGQFAYGLSCLLHGIGATV